MTAKTRLAAVPAAAARRAEKNSANGAPPSRARDEVHKRAVNRHAFQHEAEQRASMTGAGKRSSDVLEIDYSQSDVQVDLTGKASPLLHGPLVSELLVDGRAAGTQGAWKSVCAYSDEDGAYLELQLAISDTVRIDRQLFLSRDSHFALLADAVVAEGAQRIEHRLRLPLAAGAAVKPDQGTRETRVGAARAFPLWLPQDRVQSAVGDCVERDGSLELSHVVAGPGLYLPIVIDWHPGRRRAPADWRTLTVTEPARVVSPSGAAAHRLRIGKDQLVFFRGLAKTHDPRAVLGIHTWYETLFGWFQPNGELVPLMATEVD